MPAVAECTIAKSRSSSSNPEVSLLFMILFAGPMDRLFDRLFPFVRPAVFLAQDG
jgi:hypothetical protein